MENQNVSCRQRMLSIQTLGWYHSTLGGEENAEAAFSFARQCGFEAIDYHFEGHYASTHISKGITNPLYGKPLEALLAYFAPVRAAIDSQGMAISQAHGIYPICVPDNPEMNVYLLAVTEKLMEICRYLGCPSLVLHTIKELDWEQHLQLLRKLIPAAVRTGVTLCVENMFIRGEDSIAPYFDALSACRLVDQLNEEAGKQVFGVCLDVGHANLSGRDIYQDICTYGARLKCLHIHENDGVHDQHLLPYTQKQPVAYKPYVDWPAFYEGLAKIGYQGPINFEIHPAVAITPKELLQDIMKLSAAVGRYMRDCICAIEQSASV